MISFNQFLTLIEGKKKPKSLKTPPNVVPGTYHSTPEYTEFTLAPHTGPTKPFKNREDVTAEINKKGGSGRKAIENVLRQREKELKKLRKKELEKPRKKSKVDEGKVILGKGETYGSEGYQDRLEKKTKEAKERKEEEAKQINNAARNEFRHEGGMVSYEKDPKTGKVVRGRRTKDGFTPDT